MKFDDFLTHFRILFETTSGASKTMCMEVCKFSLMSHVYFSQHARAMQIIFDCELHKLIL